MNIQTQNRNVDMAQRMQQFPYWRVRTINQRNVSDTIVTYTISLLKQDQSEVQK